MYRKVKKEFGVNTKAVRTHQTTKVNKTTQTIQTTQTESLKLSEDDRAILALVQDKPTMTQKEYALELGGSVERVKYYLRKMKTLQMINRVGSSHNGHWEVLIMEEDHPREERK